ncbi:polysaccharide deacetylase family protein [Pseudoduganella sp. OTU4001]|uniref:polysaccharide deacetylase family protein n=1 Tax=Pseudoduganella sp. OTU4001 TaxID=3043854 RepID=UPI00313BDCEF
MKFIAALGAAAAALSVSLAQAQSMAITIDDGPNAGSTPLLSAQQRNQAILDALAKHKVQAALFVTSGYGASTPEGLPLLQAWSTAGHAIGNHTVTHPDLEKVSLAAYQKEVLECDRLIGTQPGYQKWLRFTYLREGNTPEKIDGMRNFLREHGYRNAHVSVDTSDWRLNEALEQALKKDPKADVSAIRTVYLAHIKQRMLAYRELSQTLQGRDIAQVMLLHHNLINAMWLDDVLAQARAMGWKIITPAEAYTDPVYKLEPVRKASGQSLLLSLGRTLGLGQMPGGERLVDDGDYEIAELKKIR